MIQESTNWDMQKQKLLQYAPSSQLSDIIPSRDVLEDKSTWITFEKFCRNVKSRESLLGTASEPQNFFFLIPGKTRMPLTSDKGGPLLNSVPNEFSYAILCISWSRVDRRFRKEKAYYYFSSQFGVKFQSDSFIIPSII